MVRIERTRKRIPIVLFVEMESISETILRVMKSNIRTADAKAIKYPIHTESYRKENPTAIDITRRPKSGQPKLFCILTNVPY
jgi:hypothetical protein